MKSTDSSSTSVLRRLARNLGILVSGTAALSLLGLGTLALNTRALGPTLFGILILVQSSTAVLNRLFSFDTWQGLIKFGAEADARSDVQGLRAVSNFALMFDAASSVAAGSAGMLLLFLFGERLGLSPETVVGAAVYMSALFLQLPGAPIGLMRLFDKFSWLTCISIGEASLRLVASAILFFTAAPLSAYLCAFGLILIAANLVRLGAALYLLRMATGSLGRSPREESRMIARRFIRFSFGSWVVGTLNVTRRDGTTLIVAALLGPAAAGLYGVAVRLSRPIRDLAELLRQAVFPDLSRLVAAAEHKDVSTVVKRVLVHTIPLAALITIAGIAIGKPALRLVAGPEYVGAYWAMVFHIASASLYLCTPLLSSLVILYAGMRLHTYAAIAAAILWAGLVAPPMMLWGIDGAGVGDLAYVAAWLALNLLLLARARRAPAP